MAYRGRKPYHKRIDSAYGQGVHPQAGYHADDVCGSSLHGLATTIERLLQEGRVDDALEQLDRCIAARRALLAGFGGGDWAHNMVIESVTRLQKVVADIKKKLEKKDHNYRVGLSSALVRYVEDTQPHKFEVVIDRGILSGGRRGRKSRTIKTKKGRLGRKRERTVRRRRLN